MYRIVNKQVDRLIYPTIAVLLVLGLWFSLGGSEDTVEPVVEVPQEETVISPESESHLSPLNLQETLTQATYTERDLECLALNSYFEARGEGLAGQIAVAQVVMNRVESDRFPNTICQVIYQGPTYTNWKGNEVPVRYKCHFSWWCDGKSDIPKDMELYESILDMITRMVEQETLDITSGSVYYHSVEVSPWWAKHYNKLMTIDNHIFYKE